MSAPEGWRLVKLATMEDRSWPEDYSHENGHYFNTCCNCQRQFMGHKRRVVCKVCASPSAPGMVSVDAAKVKPDWATCETRGPWVRNSLKVRITTMKSDVARLRKAFNKPFMGEPTKWYAEVVEDATAVLEKALAVLDAARQESK